MTDNATAPERARALAREASEAIRALNHATLPADGCPALQWPADAYVLLSDLAELTRRMPQLLEQISTFLQRQLQLGTLTVDFGVWAGDPTSAIRAATDALEGRASWVAHRLAADLDSAQQAIAFVSSCAVEQPEPRVIEPDLL